MKTSGSFLLRAWRLEFIHFALIWLVLLRIQKKSALFA